MVLSLPSRAVGGCRGAVRRIAAALGGVQTVG